MSLARKMQPRIAFTLFTGNTVGGILIASPAERPVRKVFLVVARLQRHRRLARGIDARVHRIKDAADQDRPPRNLHAELLRQRLAVVEGEIGPGTGTVEEELDHGVSSVLVFSVILILRSALLRASRRMRGVGSSGPHGSRRRKMRLLTMRNNIHFFPTTSFARWPNMFLRASSSNGSLTNLPIASPACTCGRARTSAYQRLTFG